MDRDILCMVTKISLLIAFLQCFAKIIGLMPSKNLKFFVASFHTYT
jgi:hypothetical protein